MNTLKNRGSQLLAALLLALSAGIFSPALAAGGSSIAWDKAPNKTNDLVALQNGAKLFVNYCLSCHSAAYMRYNRLQDIGLSAQDIKDNLLFTTEKVGEQMKASINPKEAGEWFGANPPDLTLVARSRSSHSGTGADYLYTYLRTYYPDPAKPTGWNNLAFPDVGMPHVLWELQGSREPIFEIKQDHGQDVKVFKGWKQITPGTMTPQQYDESMADLVSFMQWMSEPVQNTRVRVGVWVLLFLGVFSFLAWRLNAAFWKDIK